jgi:hypothetical protein
MSRGSLHLGPVFHPFNRVQWWPITVRDPAQ